MVVDEVSLYYPADRYAVANDSRSGEKEDD
jgi:hypothetical protein